MKRPVHPLRLKATSKLDYNPSLFLEKEKEKEERKRKKGKEGRKEGRRGERIWGND